MKEYLLHPDEHSDIIERFWIQSGEVNEDAECALVSLMKSKIPTFAVEDIPELLDSEDYKEYRTLIVAKLLGLIIYLGEQNVI